jgi:cell wall assembly regulator SMI1
MEELLGRLGRWLAKHRRRFHKNLQAGASDADLAALDKSLGRPAPASLKSLLKWRNGQGDDFVGYFQDHWLLLSAYRIAATKAELDQTAVDHGWNRDWLPFLDDDGGNFVCLDLKKNPTPVVVFWLDAAPEVKAPSLEAWLSDFVQGLEAGRYQEDPERGTLS